jgi:hypothetical protein
MPASPTNILKAAISELEERCTLMIRHPDERAAAAELVRWLTSSDSPLQRTGIDARLDTAIGRVWQGFHSWLPLIREGRAKPADWAGELKSGLFAVIAEIERLEEAARYPPKQSGE